MPTNSPHARRSLVGTPGLVTALPKFDGLDLAALEGRTLVNGQVAERGRGTAILGMVLQRHRDRLLGPGQRAHLHVEVDDLLPRSLAAGRQVRDLALHEGVELAGRLGAARQGFDCVFVSGGIHAGEPFPDDFAARHGLGDWRPLAVVEGLG